MHALHSFDSLLLNCFMFVALQQQQSFRASLQLRCKLLLLTVLSQSILLVNFCYSLFCLNLFFLSSLSSVLSSSLLSSVQLCFTTLISTAALMHSHSSLTLSKRATALSKVQIDQQSAITSKRCAYGLSMVSKSVNDLEWRNDRYLAFSRWIR